MMSPSSRARVTWTASLLAALIAAGPSGATPGATHTPTTDPTAQSTRIRGFHPVARFRALRRRNRVLLGAAGAVVAIKVGRRLIAGARDDLA